MAWTDEQLEAAHDAIGAIYSTPGGGTGCCLHIVVDDHNLETDSVRFCLKAARDRGHAYCGAVARMLLSMTEEERGKAVLFGVDDQTRSYILGDDIGPPKAPDVEVVPPWACDCAPEDCKPEGEWCATCHGLLAFRKSATISLEPPSWDKG